MKCFRGQSSSKKSGKGKRIMVVILVVLAVSIIIVLAGAWNIFGEKLKAAKSVRRLEDGLYYMEYNGDYGFDAFLEQGGAASDDDMAVYITKFLSNGFFQTGNNPVDKDFGCSSLCAGTVSGSQLMGRNFDWKKCNAIIVHTIPDNGYESISTCNIDFLGFGENWKPEGVANQYMALAAIYVPLDGMNEKGLCVADLINGDEEETHQKSGKTDLTIVSAIRLLLDKASTVDEAVALLCEYDMNSSIGTAHHLAVSDADGNSVVIEYVNNEMVVTQTSVVTNHYLSAGEKYGIGNEESHKRYDTLLTIWQSNKGIMDNRTLQEVMETVSYPDITQWSIVYDKTDRTLDFYWQKQYDVPYHFEFDASYKEKGE